jgi:hypothetical protein
LLKLERQDIELWRSRIKYKQTPVISYTILSTCEVKTEPQAIPRLESGECRYVSSSPRETVSSSVTGSGARGCGGSRGIAIFGPDCLVGWTMARSTGSTSIDVV